MRAVLQTFALTTSAVVLAGCGLFQASQPHEAQVSLRVADVAMAAGAPDMALRIAEIVLRRQPNDVAAMVAKGNALYALGAVDDARDAYRQAVAADPANADAQIGLGRTLVRSDPHAAETAFLAALAHQPDNTVALNDLGIARDMQGRHEEAQAAYRHALAVVPDSTDVQTNLGLSLALSGDRGNAVRTLQPVAAVPEATPMQRADLAMVLGQTGSVAPADPAQAPVRQAASAGDDTTPLMISAAPVAPVRREDLSAKPPSPVVRPVIAKRAPHIRPTPTDDVTLGSMTADASAVGPVRPVQPAIELPAIALDAGNPPEISAPTAADSAQTQSGRQQPFLSSRPTEPAAPGPRLTVVQPEPAALLAPLHPDQWTVAGYYVQIAALGEVK